ncbi:MAG: ABC transporter substrate-binding protein [Chloroflexi bacterium]|nr:ABC transporter substrate-binding protein [Chloroflexota bacterium]
MHRVMLGAGLLLALVLLVSVACRAAAPTATPTSPAATPTPTRAPATPTATTAVTQPTATPTTAAAQPTPTATAVAAPTQAPTGQGTPLDTLVAQAKARGDGAMNPWVLEQITKRNIPGRRPPLPTTSPKYGGNGGGGGYPSIQAYYEVQSLDPFTSFIISNPAINDKLLDIAVGPAYSPTTAAVNPLAAQSWEYKDNTTLVLHLTKTAKFHNKPPVNGRPVTAADWVWSFEKMRASPGVASIAARFEPVESFKALDDYTIEIKTKRPYAALLLQMGSYGFGVMPKEIYDGGKSPATEAELVGSGPWMVEKFVPGSEVRFKKNPDWWGYWSGVKDNKVVDTPNQYKLPFMDGVTWLQLLDEAAMDAGFRSQKIDMMGWQRSIRKPRYESISKTNPDATWTIFLEISNRRPWVFRVDEPPFDNIKLRQAVSAALDQDGMCSGPQAGWCVPGEYIYAGAGEWFLPNSEYGEGAKYSSYDKELAKKLLAEAGYKPGELTINFETAPWVPYTIAEGELFAANLKDVGINVKIQSRDTNAHISLLYAGNWHGVMQSFYSGGGDPDQWLRDAYHSKANGGRVLHVNDAKLDAMLDAMSGEIDHWTRVKDVYEIIRYMAVQRYATYASGAFVFPYVAQPYVKNQMFSAQQVGWGWSLARAWIDRENPNVGFQSL